MEALEQQIKKSGAISGLILGAILMVLGIVNFYFITSIATSFIAIILGPIIISIVIPIVIALLFISDLRKRIGGFWAFKQATTGIFIMFFVANLLSFSGNLFFNKVIEPAGIDKMKTAMINATTQMMEKQNASQDRIDQNVAQIEKKFDEQKDQSIGKIGRGIITSIIFCFVFSLIFAALYKRERPLYQAPPDEPEPTV